MATGDEPRIYDVEIDWQDAGYAVPFRLDDWWEMVEKDFTSFDVLKSFYGADLEKIREHLRDEMTKFDTEDPSLDDLDPEVPRLRISNPPKEWIEDPAEAAQFFQMYNHLLARMGLYNLLNTEFEAERDLIDDGRFNSTVIRQSTFFEEYLTFQSQLALQQQKDGVLSKKELNLIDGMRHGDRIRFAHLIGVIDEEEHGLLQEMAGWRNDVAHTAWVDIDQQDEAQIRSTVERVHEYLGNLLEEGEEPFEEIEGSGQIDDFDLGFGGLSVDQQALQLAIFTVLNARGGTTTLGDIQDIVEDEPGRIETRCHRMRSVGYVEMNGDEVRLTDEGWAFVENEL